MIKQEKICDRCGLPKPLKDYGTYKDTRSGKRYYRNFCVQCGSKRLRSYNNGIGREKAKSYNATKQRKRLYGITQIDFDSMLLDQNFNCGICGKGIDSSAHLDHNHMTGELRELLCSNCNVLLGLVGEDINVLEKAIEYLKRWD